MFRRINRALLIFVVTSASGQAGAPFIASVTSTTADGSYKLGTDINITVNLSEAVTLTDAKMEIVLETGDTDRSVYIAAFADLQSSVSTTYTVRKGDQTSALSANSITLSATGNSPSIKDSEANALINFTPSANLNAVHSIAVDGVVPAAPSGFTATAGYEAITLTWSANSEIDFARYIIYGGEASAPTTPVDTITTISEVSTTIPSLTNDVLYFYRLTAEDALGNSSSYSTEISATPFSPPVAGAIRDGIFETKDEDWWNNRSSVTFNWDAFEDNGAVSYQIAIGTSMSDLGNTVDWTVVSGTTVTVPGLNLIEGFTYYLSVRGTDVTAKSDTITSDGITIDLTSPTGGTINDGSIEEGIDLIFFNSAVDFSANWNGFTDVTNSGVSSGIALLTYSLGTSPGDSNIVGQTVLDPQDWVTVNELNLAENSTYYFSLFATDSAGNTSPTVSSNGLIIDLTGPTVGEVIDVTAYHFIIGDLSDRDWINFSTSLVAYWYGFSDLLSGISTYETAVLNPDGIPINEWESPMTDSTEFILGLEMEDAKTYTIAVRVTDVAGNISIGESDGISVDLTPPSFKSQSTERILLSETGLVEIIFSEAVASVEVSASASLADTVLFKSAIKGDTLSITTLPPFASLDSVTFTLTNVTDTRQLVTDAIEVKFATRMLGDYDDNLQIDISDIDRFAVAWPNVDFAPVTGEPPFFILNPDGTTDLRDAMAFSRMWRWSNKQADTTSRQFVQQGIPPRIEISSDGFSISIPEEARSGELEIQSHGYPVHLTNETASGSGLFLSQESPGKSGYLINFALFNTNTEEKETELSFSTESILAEDVRFSYIFYGDSRQIISSGSVTFSPRSLPEMFTLHQNFPNPFNPVTTINYDVPDRSQVEIVVLDLLGRHVTTLVNEEVAAGFHSTIWNARDDSGRQVGSGTFLLRMKSASFTKVRKMLLLR